MASLTLCSSASKKVYKKFKDFLVVCFLRGNGDLMYLLDRLTITEHTQAEFGNEGKF